MLELQYHMVEFLAVGSHICLNPRINDIIRAITAATGATVRYLERESGSRTQFPPSFGLHAEFLGSNIIPCWSYSCDRLQALAVDRGYLASGALHFLSLT